METAARSVRIEIAADGSRLHLVDLAPDALPPIGIRDLRNAWDAAHAGAVADLRGARRGFGFRGPDGAVTLLSLADTDASCWAQAVERLTGLDTVHGLAVCVRLLALVDRLVRDPALAPLYSIEGGGAQLHPALLRTAATLEISPSGRFDAAGFRRDLAHVQGIALTPTGVSA
jgi:hypothetical protein